MAIDWSQFKPAPTAPASDDMEEKKPAGSEFWNAFTPVTKVEHSEEPVIRITGVQNLNSQEPRNPIAEANRVKPVPMTAAEQKEKRRSFMKGVKEVVQSPIRGAAQAVVGVVDTVQDLNREFRPEAPPDSALRIFEDFYDVGSAMIDEAKAKLEPETTAGQISAALFRFGIPYSLVTRGMQTTTLAAKMLKPIAAGTAVDMAVFDPYEARLSNIAAESNTVFNNAMTQWMAADKDDPFLEAKMKQAFEGTALGLTFEGVIAMARVVKAARKARGSLGADVSKMKPVTPTGVKLPGKGPKLGTTGDDAEALLTLQANFGKVNKAHDDALQIKRALEETIETKMARFFSGENWIDASSSVKKELLKRGGDAGKRAVMMHDLTAGATPAAQNIFQHRAKNIYGGLTKDDITWLDKMINSRRIVQIDSYKGVGKVKHFRKLDGAQHADFLRQMRLEIGDEAFSRIQARADQYFDAMLEQLTDLHSAKVISDDLFNQLKNFDYSPTEFLHKIDPVQKIEIGGRKITVQDSGIKMIEGGSNAAVEMSSQELLAQVIGRTQGRIMRNNANRALLDLARDVPDNGIVKVPKKVKHSKSGRAKPVRVPAGMTRLTAMVDGKQMPIFMDESLAQQWITQNPQMSRLAANTLRWASGSSIVRPLATGLNPEFALTNLPRDILHIYMSTDQYSPHLPIFGAQMARDMASTAADAFLRRGRYEDYIREGGGMSFLTHQGQELFTTAGDDMLRQMNPHFRRTKAVMGYLGETAEVWARLALRERAIRGGASAQEATWIGRNYLDFSQGGKITKSADHAIPYLNAATQAVRGVLRHAKQHPVQFATKTAWLNATAGLLYMANYTENPEAMAQIPDHVKQDFFIFTTGMKFVDARGNTRHVYFKIRKDDTVVPLLFPMDAAMIKYFEDRDIDRSAIDTVVTSLPLIQSRIPVPSLDALSSYATNYDMWFGDDIWRRGDTLPYPLSKEEYLGPGQSVQPTPRFWVDLGEYTGLSPERARRAFSKIAPKNIFTDAVGGGWKLMTEGLEEADKDATTQELLAASPFLRRAMSLTHPAETEFDRIDAIADPARAAQIQINRDLDALYNEFQQGRLNGGTKSVETWINSKPPEVRKQLKDRFTRRMELDEAMRPYKGTAGLPSQIWWTNLASQPTDVRAELFYNEYVARTSDKRQQMKGIASRFPGFWTPDMQRDFARIVRDRGDEEH